jgi:hypothetical protein
LFFPYLLFVKEQSSKTKLADIRSKFRRVWLKGGCAAEQDAGCRSYRIYRAFYTPQKPGVSRPSPHDTFPVLVG